MEGVRKRIITIILAAVFGVVLAAPVSRPQNLLLSGGAFQQPSDRLSVADPSDARMSAERLSRIDSAVAEAISNKELPGAVVLIARHGRVVWRKAYGNRAVQPQLLPMTVDTVFDLASLTKVVATATSTMILVERGQVSLDDPVVKHIPEFGKNGKERITIQQLLAHRAGFIPDNEIADYLDGPQVAIERIYNLAPVAEPGSRFIYSDVGFIVLGEIIKRVSGKPVDEFAAENIFKPLGMKDTAYKPGGALAERAAPTEQREGRWMRGEVHDPRAYLLGGVAGHAGLFSTADDLAIFCQMILNGGHFGGARVLGPLAVARMTSPQPALDDNMRGLGWDIATSFSVPRGDLYPAGSFGHTGFTGTSFWIDPATDSFVIILSNRVHPDGRGNAAPLRSRIANIAAAAIMDAPAFVAAAPVSRTRAPSAAIPDTQVLTGIDVLVRDRFAPLAGRRVGLITNHTGLDRRGRSTIDLLYNAGNLKLVKLFSPEHGIRGVLDSRVSDSVDEKTGLHIYSLYGETRRPTVEMLKDIDTLVFDIQDIGARFYTYITTLGYAMEEAAKHGIKVVVLDRPNPINGVDTEGPPLEKGLESFTGYHQLPVRHGMTVGELARMFNDERKIGADLTVIKLEDWRREQWLDSTGLTWVNPSPNMRSLTQATLYPGIGLLETTNLSVGRGTDTPFEVIGAPWIDGQALAAALNARRIPGARFVPIRFTPRSSVFANEACGGINIIITNRSVFKPVACGIEIACQLRKLYPDNWKIDNYIRLLANRAVFEDLRSGKSSAEIISSWDSALNEFRNRRQKYLLY